MLLSYLTLFLVFGLSFGDVLREHTPEERRRILGPLGLNFTRASISCSNMGPSPNVPTSVHALRPGDIKHIASLGDSLTAANGAKAWTIIGLLTEYRGVSWSIGGDSDLGSVVTLSNIMRRFNSQITGFSTGTGNRDSTGAGFNVAKAGAVSTDMPEQANILVDRMISKLGQTRFNEEWKLVTFFIGGNDLCAVCTDPVKHSPTQYRDNVKAALDILKARMPRTLVNLVTVLNVAELEDLHQGWVCTNMQVFLCDCAIKQGTRETVRQAVLEYQRLTNQLIDSGVYDSADDFTVVRQPFMEHMTAPSKPDGSADFSYFAPDCFHFSQKGHEMSAIELWNNMMEKVGQKTTFWNMDSILKCPSGNGYIYTSKNSN